MADIDERQALIDASQHVLIRGSRCELKVRNVCRQASVSTHSFYRHFNGKDELMIAVLEREVNVLAAWLRAETEKGTTPGQRVWNFVRAEIERAVDLRSDTGVLVDRLNWRAVMNRRPDVYERCLSALTAPLAAALADGHAAGELRSPDPVKDARFITHMIRGNALDAPDRGRRNLRDDVENSVVWLISRAIGLKYGAGV